MSSESEETGELASAGGNVSVSVSPAHPARWGPALILSLEDVSENVNLGGELSCVIHVQRGASCHGGSHVWAPVPTDAQRERFKRRKASVHPGPQPGGVAGVRT